MMSAAREKDQADFDLERFIDMFDEAVNSRDPRVVNALRSLMMIVTLTRPESRDLGLHDRNAGPLRRMFEDMNHLQARLYRLEEEIRSLQLSATESEKAAKWNRAQPYDYPYEKYAVVSLQQDVAEQNTLINHPRTVALAKGLTKK